jgi:DNA invertase Pin-like site-specific DNA recombinase
MARTARTIGIVAYTRVSTDEQANSGLGLAAQRAAIENDAARRGLPIVAWHEDAGVSAKTLNRPGLAAAIDDVARGVGSVLVVAKLDRLSRSVHDATGIMRQAEREGWALAAIDLGIDMSTPSGAAMAGVAAVFAELERRLISERTKAALAIKKAEGVKLGRPVTMDERTVALIKTLRTDGLSLRATVAHLNAAGVPTARGGQWAPATVAKVLANEGLGLPSRAPQRHSSM